MKRAAHPDVIARDEFIALERKPGRTLPENARLIVLKLEMADRFLSLPARNGSAAKPWLGAVVHVGGGSWR